MIILVILLFLLGLFIMHMLWKVPYCPSPTNLTTFENIRNQIRPGDVLISTHCKLFSHASSLMVGCNNSSTHTGVVVDTPDGLQVMHLMYTFKIDELDKWVRVFKNGYLTWLPYGTDKNIKFTSDEIKMYQTIKFDFLYPFRPLVGKRKNEMLCTEFVARVLADKGLIDETHIDKYKKPCFFINSFEHPLQFKPPT